jgi:hypothetical protein
MTLGHWQWYLISKLVIDIGGFAHHVAASDQ